MRGNLRREWWFFLHDRQAVITVLAAALLATIALSMGLRDIALQNQEIVSLQTRTLDDLQSTLVGQPDPGSAAYYGFRLVYDPPSNLAFAARGVRDELPWKHRLRILALEGQIYENDSDNPELAQAGQIDFAFLISVLAPLLIILLLHDVADHERRSNRLDLLAVTAGDVATPIRWRSGVRLVALAIALTVPFVLAALWSGAATKLVSLLAVLAVGYVLLWGAAVTWIAGRMNSAAATATVLLGLWAVLVMLVPLSAGAIAERSVTVPQGGEILLNQREVVNRAWDLPEEVTMDAFVESHPKWSDYKELGDGFEWKWYYAFQQLGDESVAAQSQALRVGVRQRDAIMAMAAWLSPPLFVDRIFTRVARTDIAAFQRYETCARQYHEYLRREHYPMIFGAKSYDVDQLLGLENTKDCSGVGEGDRN